MLHPLKREELIPGPWDNDLNNYPAQNHTFKYHDYQCRIKRNLDTWTYDGRILLPSNHPDYKKTADLIENDIHIHGGVTYGSNGTFGFSCNAREDGDLSPAEETFFVKHPKLTASFININKKRHYWTYDDTVKEVENMVRQFENRMK